MYIYLVSIGSEFWQQLVDEHQFTRRLDKDIWARSDLFVTTEKIINYLLFSTWKTKCDKNLVTAVLTAIFSINDYFLPTTNPPHPCSSQDGITHLYLKFFDPLKFGADCPT